MGGGGGRGGRGGNYQMQIVTKLPNEYIQTYQLQISHVKLKNEATICVW